MIAVAARHELNTSAVPHIAPGVAALAACEQNSTAAALRPLPASPYVNRRVEGRAGVHGLPRRGRRHYFAHPVRSRLRRSITARGSSTPVRDVVSSLTRRQMLWTLAEVGRVPM